MDRLYVAGLLACSLLLNLPIPPQAEQWLVETTVVVVNGEWSMVNRELSNYYSKFTIDHSSFTKQELTATGIAPDLHRTSLLIPTGREPNTAQM